MIVGIGVDIASVIRIEKFLERWGERGCERCFTEAEQAYCEARRRPATHYASRFAAKEALGKALGTGIAGGVYWRDIEVVRSAGGPPRIVLHGGAREAAEALGASNIQLSLSHDADLAIAYVILEK
jgi:holo-[acyl-carrier protein] synthase